MDKGSGTFVTNFNNITDLANRKEMLTFIVNQLISTREFSDKLHFILKESLALVNLHEVSEIQMTLNKHFKYLFNAKTVHLWIPDGVNKIFYIS